MKILVLQDHLRSGGTERQAIALTRGFRRAGHAAGLLTFRPGGRLAPAAADLSPVVLQPFDSRVDAWVPGLGAALRAEDPDVILLMGRTANTHAGLVGRRAPRAAVLGTVRSGYELPFLYARALHRTRAIIANSGEAAERLCARYGYDPGRVTAIHNALLCPAHTRERNSRLRQDLGAGPGTLVLLDVAMFRPEKNHTALIRAASELPPDLDWQLWLAGEGPTRAACARQAAGLGLSGRIRFTGFCGDPGPLYRAADLAVHASLEESLCNFVIEAQAHGLPAVVFQALGMAECMRPADTGWILAQGDRAGFCAAVLRLAAEAPESRLARAERARQFAREGFDPDRQTQAYLNLFTRVTDPR